MTVGYRALAEPDVEITTRAGKRELRGIVVPYNHEQRIDSKLVESFAPGAFRKQISAASRIPFFRNHEAHGGVLIGKALELREDAGGLFGAFRISPTVAGDEALALAEDGVLTQWSIGFRSGQDRRLPNGTIERVTATLFETALVLRGAYGDHAAVSEVREEASTIRLDEARRILAALPILPAA